MESSKGNCYPAGRWVDFLKACLIRGQAGEDAWYSWVEAVGTPSALKSTAWRGTKRWWPLLSKALQRNQIKVPSGLATALKSAYMTETIRYDYCRQVADEVLSILQKAGFDPVLNKGMAFAETIYEQPALRHCHELDIIICQGPLKGAVKALGSDFRFPRPKPTSTRSRLDLVHRSGLPLKLQSKSSAISWSGESNTDMFIYNKKRQCNILTPELMLAQVCFEADEKGDFPFDWISDGLQLISIGNLNRYLLNTIELSGDAAEVINERLCFLDNMA